MTIWFHSNRTNNHPGWPLLAGAHHRKKNIMKNIFKYPLKATEWQFVSMPEGAEILCVQTQRETPCLWALVDPAMAPKMRKIYVYGTGHDIPDNLHLAYIGTFQLEGGTLVFHAFEATESDSATAEN